MYLFERVNKMVNVKKSLYLSGAIFFRTIAKVSSRSSCLGFFYQPQVPKKLKKGASC